MKKLTFLLICCFCLFSIDGFSQSKKSKTTKSRKTRQPMTSVHYPIFSVEVLRLSQKEVFTKCQNSKDSCSEENSQIQIQSVAQDSGDGRSQIKYVYDISGGKIIGEGANVIWDLSDAKPGSYTITAGISQPIFNGERWEVLGKKQTVFVTIKECPDCK